MGGEDDTNAERRDRKPDRKRARAGPGKDTRAASRYGAVTICRRARPAVSRPAGSVRSVKVEVWEPELRDRVKKVPQSRHADRARGGTLRDAPRNS